MDVPRRLEQLRENYPRDNFYSSLNLVGSHDRERLFTVLGGAPDPDSVPEAERAGYRPPGQRPDKRARRLIRALGDIDAS